MSARLAWAFAIALLACGAPAVPAPPDDGTVSVDTACRNLERLQCREAAPARDGTPCVEVLRRMARIVDPHLACVSRAVTVNAVRACGSVRCLD